MYDDNPDMMEQPESSEEKIKEELKAFIHELETRAEKRAKERQPIEKRWLADLRQYHGIYDEDTLLLLKAKKKSQVFMNLTRPKTNGVIARLWDLLFPTDDRNWSIQSTPVPEMDRTIDDSLEIASAAEENMQAAGRRMEEAAAAENAQGVEQAKQQMNEAQAILQEAEEQAEKLQEAKRAANAKALLMQDEIDDQLKASRYGAEARDMIADGCKLGTGILKGPVIQGKIRRRFQQTPDGYALVEVDDNAPAAQWVDPWSFFPDPNAKNPADGEGCFERHLLNAAQMRDLQKRTDIDVDALRRVMRNGPKANNAPWYLTELTNLTQDKTTVVNDCWTVWEYSGEITGEELGKLAQAISAAKEEYDAVADETGEVDPLLSVSARIWFCDGEILSFAIHPLDSQECMYSIWNYEPAEHGPWGYGVPYIMRHEQVTVNAAKRMIMDLGALSAGPQVLVNKSMVTPENGEWVFESGKTWLWNTPEDGQPVTDPFKLFFVDAKLNELAGIIDLAKQTIEEITIPSIGQTDQASVDHTTFKGLALKLGNANIMLRRLVRDFDDQITTPIIRRFYEWNMQFSEKEEIKGDYEVEARGSTVLVVREMQAENLMMIANSFGDHPTYGPLLKHKAIMDLIFRALMVPTADIVKTPREVEADAKAAMEQPNPEAQAQQMMNELKQMELQIRQAESENKVEIANMEADSRRYVADRTYDAALSRLETQFNIKAEELEAADARIMAENDSKERRLAAEVAMAQRTGKSSGGAV